MKIPVLEINQFENTEPLKDVYVNTFSNHLRLNKKMISKPHKHNFYLCVLFTKGTGLHEIDFNSYEICPGKVFFLRPGQTHFWKFTSDPEGFIFFHSQEYFEFSFLKHKLSSFHFYASFRNPPLISLSQKDTVFMADKFKELYYEYRQEKMWSQLKIVSLLNIIYIDLSRKYSSIFELKNLTNSRYLSTFQSLEGLIDEHYKTQKLPKFYAGLLSMTTKHLNRIVKSILGKTTTDLISERVILEAKRLIVRPESSLTTIAYHLGFTDYSYFSKLFKSKTSLTPVEFKNKYT